MIIHFTLIVPPPVCQTPDRLTPWVQSFLPTTLTPDMLTLKANRDIGLSIEFDLTYPNIADAATALAIFFRLHDKLPDPPS